MKKRIMIVAAHPDDEVLGVGGTVAKLALEGNEIYTLILGEGITSRDKVRDVVKRKSELESLKNNMFRANEIIGVREVFSYDLPDNRLDSISFLDIIKMIEEVKNKIKPDVIYTHFWADLNIDHRITYKAVLTACRPIKNETVKKIYCFEVFSSTEWNYPNIFNPNVFVDISEHFETKLKALKCYESELREFPYPRSEEAVRVAAKNWGRIAGARYAEGFSLVREIR